MKTIGLFISQPMGTTIDSSTKLFKGAATGLTNLGNKGVNKKLIILS